MSPSVGAIVPVYNAERFIAEALDSVLGQTVPPEVVIVVDDGSNDESATIARSYGSAVTVVHQPNAGPASARNTGLDRLTTDLVAFCDADDVWDEHKIERQLDAITLDPSIEVCFCRIANFWDGAPAERDRVFAERNLTDEFPFPLLQSVLARRDVFERIGRFDPQLLFGEDVDWYRRVLGNDLHVHTVDAVLVRRRVHADNLTKELVGDLSWVWLQLAQAAVRSKKNL